MIVSRGFDKIDFQLNECASQLLWHHCHSTCLPTKPTYKSSRQTHYMANARRLLADSKIIAAACAAGRTRAQIVDHKLQVPPATIQPYMKYWHPQPWESVDSVHLGHGGCSATMRGESHTEGFWLPGCSRLAHASKATVHVPCQDAAVDRLLLKWINIV